MPVDTALVGALHVDYLKKRNLAGDHHAHHTLFQTSTIDALLKGKYDGDISFAAPVSRPGDSVRLRAEVDLIVVLSACPQDLVPVNGDLRAPQDVYYRLLLTDD